MVARVSGDRLMGWDCTAGHTAVHVAPESAGFRPPPQCPRFVAEPEPHLCLAPLVQWVRPVMTDAASPPS